MTDQPCADEIVANPLPLSLSKKLITDDLESLDEVEVATGLQSFLEEDWDCPPAEQEQMRNNKRDAPLAVQIRKKRKSYLDLKDDSTEETLSVDFYFDFDPVLGDDQIQIEEDPEATRNDVTNRPVPGYQEIHSDKFQARKQKRKGFAYVLGHCISADGMSAGIATKFSEHFPDLRERVEGEVRKRGTLLAIDRPEEQCWVYILVTKDKYYEKPTTEDLEQSLMI